MVQLGFKTGTMTTMLLTEPLCLLLKQQNNLINVFETIAYIHLSEENVQI